MVFWHQFGTEFTPNYLQKKHLKTIKMKTISLIISERTQQKIPSFLGTNYNLNIEIVSLELLESTRIEGSFLPPAFFVLTIKPKKGKDISSQDLFDFGLYIQHSSTT